MTIIQDALLYFIYQTKVPINAQDPPNTAHDCVLTNNLMYATHFSL